MRKNTPSRTAGRRYTGLLSRLMWLIGLMCVLVFITSALFGMRSFQNTLVTSVEELEADYVKVQADNVDTLLKLYCTKLYEMAVDNNLLDLAIKMAQGNEDAQTVHDVRTKLSAHIMSESVYVAATLSLDGETFQTVSRLHDSSKWESWFSPVPSAMNDAALKDLCQRAGDAQGLVAGTSPDRRERSTVRFFHLACPLYDLMTKKQYGTVILTVNSSVLAEIVNPVSAEQQISMGALVAPDGTVMCHSQPAMVGGNLSVASDFGENKLLLSAQTKHLGLTVYRVVDRALLMARAERDFVLQNVAIMLLTLGLFAAVSLLMHRMTRSTRSLLRGIERLGQGETNVRVQVSDTHEIGQITSAFNTLAGQLEEAREQEAIHARKSLEALRQQYHAEMRALERQINAHFLNNTLNTINYTAIESGNTEVSRQIRYLASILRYSYENSSGVVTAAQVMGWLDNYLPLQKLRFGDSLDYTGVVDDAVRDWPMRKLLIQPFVENAILHGFAGRNFGCLLQIRFQPFGADKMRVTITDNGKGIPPHEVEMLNAYFRGERESLPFSEGVGLANARQRLLLFYRGEAKVFYRSQVNTQTVVTLLLPRYKEEADISPADR